MNKMKWLTYLANGTSMLGLLTYIIFISSEYYVESPLDGIFTIAIFLLILSNSFLQMKLDFIEKNKTANWNIFLIVLDVVIISLGIFKVVMKCRAM